jgi:hypothetical protein
MTRELLCAAASECCISAYEKVTPDLTFVVGPCPLRARPSHGTERPWTSYSAISPFSDSTSNGGCRFSGVWPRCTRFGSLDTGREIRDAGAGGDTNVRWSTKPSQLQRCVQPVSAVHLTAGHMPSAEQVPIKKRADRIDGSASPLHVKVSCWFDRWRGFALPLISSGVAL